MENRTTSTDLLNSKVSYWSKEKHETTSTITRARNNKTLNSFRIIQKDGYSHVIIDVIGEWKESYDDLYTLFSIDDAENQRNKNIVAN